MSEGGGEDKGPSRRPRTGRNINISWRLQAGVAEPAGARGAEPGLVLAVYMVQAWSIVTLLSCSILIKRAGKVRLF